MSGDCGLGAICTAAPVLADVVAVGEDETGGNAGPAQAAMLATSKNDQVNECIREAIIKITVAITNPWILRMDGCHHGNKSGVRSSLRLAAGQRYS